MEWVFRIGYLFVIIYAFGLTTNGSKRIQITMTGFTGAVIVMLISIILSIATKTLLFLGVLFEMTIAFFLFMAIFGFLFRKIPKPDNRSLDDFVNKSMKDLKLKKMPRNRDEYYKQILKDIKKNEK